MLSSFVTVHGHAGHHYATVTSDAWYHRSESSVQTHAETVFLRSLSYATSELALEGLLSLSSTLLMDPAVGGPLPYTWPLEWRHYKARHGTWYTTRRGVEVRCSGEQPYNTTGALAVPRTGIEKTRR